MIDNDNQAEAEIQRPIEDIKPNSDAYNRGMEEKRKKREQIDYTVTVKKKTFGQKLKEAIFGEDVKNVPDYVFFKIIVPNVVRMFGDSISGALSMTFRDINRSRRSRDDDDDTPYREYNRISRDRERRRANAAEPDFSDYIISSKEAVEYIIDQLDDLTDDGYIITVRDVCSYVGKTPKAVDNKYGWKSTRDFEAVKTEGGWYLSVPRAKYYE